MKNYAIFILIFSLNMGCETVKKLTNTNSSEVEAKVVGEKTTKGEESSQLTPKVKIDEKDFTTIVVDLIVPEGLKDSQSFIRGRDFLNKRVTSVIGKMSEDREGKKLIFSTRMDCNIKLGMELYENPYISEFALEFKAKDGAARVTLSRLQVYRTNHTPSIFSPGNKKYPQNTQEAQKIYKKCFESVFVELTEALLRKEDW